MAKVFITSKTAANRHGVFAIERRPPTVVTAIGTGQAAIVGQFPWGPAQRRVSPTSVPDLLDTFAPPGMDRTGSAYLSIIGKGWPLPPRVVRVVGPDAAKATATIVTDGAEENMLTLTAKHVGEAGNSIVATVRAASDGDADHFDLEIAVSGPSGSTVETLRNLNFSGVGEDTVLTPADLEKLKLLGGITKIKSGVPKPGTYTFSGGSNGSVTAADYVGTAGTGNKGMALLEGDSSIRVFFVDDPGSALRDAVNAGGMAHAELMGDRVFFANGPSGQADVEDVKDDVKGYRSNRVVYCDPWVYQRDDVDGSERLVPSAPFAASVACQLSPSTSIAWKAPEVQAMLAGIVRLEYERGEAVGDLTEAGVCCFIQEEEGGFTIESDTTALGNTDPGRKSLRRTRMGDYIAISFARSNRPNVDAPNVPVNQADVAGSLQSFLAGLKRARDFDPNHNPHIMDFRIVDPSASNTPESIAAGEFNIDAEIQIAPAMSKIFLNVAFGETVTVTAQ